MRTDDDTNAPDDQGHDDSDNRLRYQTIMDGDDADDDDDSDNSLRYQNHDT